MIVDTSAVVAVIKREPGWERLLEVLETSSTTRMSAGTYLELGIVIDRKRDANASRQLDHLLDRWGVEIVPVDATLARAARSAHRDYGRGSGHPAQLNYGDCFSYALASSSGEELLFVGDDFVHTDVVRA